MVVVVETCAIWSSISGLLPVLYWHYISIFRGFRVILMAHFCIRPSDRQPVSNAEFTPPTLLNSTVSSRPRRVGVGGVSCIPDDTKLANDCCRRKIWKLNMFRILTVQFRRACGVNAVVGCRDPSSNFVANGMQVGRWHQGTCWLENVNIVTNLLGVVVMYVFLKQISSAWTRSIKMR
jgi:hypothetical protein